MQAWTSLCSQACHFAADKDFIMPDSSLSQSGMTGVRVSPAFCWVVSVVWRFKRLAVGH